MSNHEPLGAAASPPGLAPLAIDHDSRYVLGFPLHVAIVVCAAHPGTCMRDMPRPSWAGNAGAIGVRLTRADTGDLVVNIEPWPVVSPEIGTPVFTLCPGACRRMLIDVSSFVPARQAPGSYRIQIVYVSPPDRAASPEVEVELAAPSEAERGELEVVEPGLVHARSWGRWTSLPPEPGEPIEKPGDARDPLRFNKVLRYLMFGPEELAEVDLSLIDVLEGVYAPESHALRAELYAARGDAARFRQEASIVRTWYPGLTWWIERIDEGRSEIAFVRSCRGRVCPPAP